MARLLDLFCGAGGAAVGYHRAGFEVVGVDVEPQPNYPFAFIRADAMEIDWSGFDVIHASPPCQTFSRTRNLVRAQGGTTRALDLLAPLRDRLRGNGADYVIENVPGAPMNSPMVLCGSMFELRVRRHRLFESNRLLDAPSSCSHKKQGRPVGVYHRLNDEVPHGGRTAKTLDEARCAMGIDWMTWKELTQAIPPAYTEWIGRRLLGRAEAS